MYALLGVSRWDRTEAVKVDYSTTAEQTYINATMKLIQEEGSLNLLRARVGKSQFKDLPSWVQDWTEPFIDGQGFDTLEKHVLYNKINIQFKAELCCDNIFKVNSVEVDTITSLWRICKFETGSELVAVLNEWENMVATASPGLHGTYINGQVISDAFRRTLGGDMVRQTRSLARGIGGRPPEFYRVGDFRYGRRSQRGDDSDEDLSRDWWYAIVERDFPDVEIKDAWVAHVHNVVVPLVKNNKFFLTEHGLMGIGPMGTAIGDKVHMVRGAQLPFVLRHSSDKRHGSDGCRHPAELCFAFVGTSYAHGIMDGEAFTDPKARELEIHLC